MKMLFHVVTTTSNSSTLINKKRSTQNSNPIAKRKRNIIWFNPPYSKNVRTNVAHKFLALTDKHFPKSSVLHKIFNRNSVKVSYSCMPNAKSNISNHNRRVLNNKMTSINEKTCNCRAESNCPLDGKCLITSIGIQSRNYTYRYTRNQGIHRYNGRPFQRTLQQPQEIFNTCEIRQRNRVIKVRLESE